MEKRQEMRGECCKRHEPGKAQDMPKSFHQRPLPPTCVAFSSPEGRQLFQEAIVDGHMAIYFPLAEQFTTQTEPSFCGLGMTIDEESSFLPVATLAMCLNALRVDPCRQWKSAWRWYSDDMLDCCTSVDTVKQRGLSFDEFIALARCEGLAAVETRATPAISLDSFRATVRASCATSTEVLVINYSRKTLGQTGDGHFSPIGGYHAASDMVLVMDVARFKYPPHWVSLSLLFQALQTIDTSSGLPRGFISLRVEVSPQGNPDCCCSSVDQPCLVTAN
ncbi:hypothetical protein AC1031_003938 [Aphanomyces cochlioides]|nr:hypothetical protein AC1031_003938 [Aphanomyces cochlioides]